MSWIRTRLTYANVMSSIALFAVLGGGAYAAQKIGPNDIRKNAVRSKHIKNKAVKPNDLAGKTKRRLRGNRGPRGPVGPRGATGARGPAGLPGSAGPVFSAQGGALVDDGFVPEQVPLDGGPNSTVHFNGGFGFTQTNSGIVAPASGMYLLTLHRGVCNSGTTAGFEVTSSPLGNGTTYLRVGFQGHRGDLTGAHIARLQAGASLYLSAFRDGGAAQDNCAATLGVAMLSAG